MALLKRAVYVIDKLRWIIVLTWVLFGLWALKEGRLQRYAKLLKMNTPVVSHKQVRASSAFVRASIESAHIPHPFRLLVVVAGLDSSANVTQAVVLDFMHTLVPFLESESWVVSVTGYGTPLPAEDRARFISRDSSHAVLYVRHEPMPIQTLMDRIHGVEHFVDALASRMPNFSSRYSAVVVQESLLLNDATNVAMHDTAATDVITVALGLAILSWNLGWSAFFALPCLFATFLLSVTISIPFEKIHNFEVWEPSIFFGAGVAVSFDYTLFLMSTFQDSLTIFPVGNRMRPDELRSCVEVTLRSAGHPVLLSGLVLALCFYSITYTKFESIKSLGIGGVTIVGSCLISSLSLLPAFMLCSGRFRRFRLISPRNGAFRWLLRFTKFGRFFPWRAAISRKLSPQLWRDIAITCAQYPRFVLFLFAAVFVLALPFALHLRPGADQLMLLPGNSHHSQALQGLLKVGLRGGLICPVYAILEMNEKALRFFTEERRHDFPSTTTCVDNDLQFVVEARNYFKGMADMSCAEAQSLLDICNGEFRISVLYLCKRTCGVCDGNGHLVKVPDISDTQCEAPVIFRGNKSCWPGYRLLPVSGVTSLESCRASCCHNPACTYLQWSGHAKCYHGVALTKPICRPSSHQVTEELLYRAHFDLSLGVAPPFLNEHMWSATKEAVTRLRAILTDLGWPCSSCVRSITELPGGFAISSATEANKLLHSDSTYAKYVRGYVGEGGESVAQSISIELPFSPFSYEGELFLRHARLAFPEDEELFSCCKVFIFDLYENIVEAKDEVLSSMLPSLGGVGGAVFFLVGIAFKSVIIPIRLLVTIVFTLVVVAALVFWRFQYFGGYSSFYWLSMVCITPILIGLTLDYDLFLISRVSYYREQGYSTHDAVVRGCWKTGKTISFAGLIMSIAFSAEIWSDMPLIRCFGFSLVYGTIIDTFLVRPLLVPALMLAVHSESNWWPHRMPPVTKSNSEDDDESSFDHIKDFDLPELASEYVDMATDVEDN